MKTIRGLLILVCVGFFALGAAATNSYAEGQCGPWNNFCDDGPGCGPWNNFCHDGPGCGPWNIFCHNPTHNKKKCGPWNDFCHQGGGGMGMPDNGGGMGQEGGGKVSKKKGGCPSYMKQTKSDDNSVSCICDGHAEAAERAACAKNYPNGGTFPR